MHNYTQDELTHWINNKARGLTSSYVQKKLLHSPRGATPQVGNLYFFKYDPKWKEKLTIYDIYPMAFPIKMYGNGFLGLNMHYLPMGARRKFVQLVNDYRAASPDSRIDVTTELFNELTRTKRIYDMVPQTVHRYLYVQMKSRAITILPEEYEKAVQLRIDEWVIKDSH